MLERFREFLTSNQLAPPKSRLLLAVSGGADSMAMLHLFIRIQNEFELHLEVAHLHHGIRGADADADAAFVEEACRKLDVPFRSFKFNVPAFAFKQKFSLEDAGRRVRHHFFSRLARVRKLDRIAFAHTSDDQVETILFNFMRGAGPRGLAGISARRQNIIHPLLRCSKSELLDFLKSNKISYCEDGTNQVSSYSRNKIRLEILPFLEEQTGIDVKKNLLRSAEIFRVEESWIDELVIPLFQSRFHGLGDRVFELRISPDENLPVALQRRLIRKFLETSLGCLDGIGFSHVEQLLALLSKQAGKRFEFFRYFVERTSKGLAISIQSTPWNGELNVVIPGETEVDPLSVRLHTEVFPFISEEFENLKTSKSEVFLDWDSVKPPVRLRTRRPGDSFSKAGLDRRGKKLQDYFVDRKIPRLLRDRIPLVVCPQGILWVGGYDMADRCKVTEKTKRILRLRLVHDQRN